MLRCDLKLRTSWQSICIQFFFFFIRFVYFLKLDIFERHDSSKATQVLRFFPDQKMSARDLIKLMEAFGSSEPSAFGTCPVEGAGGYSLS